VLTSRSSSGVILCHISKAVLSERRKPSLVSQLKIEHPLLPLEVTFSTSVFSPAAAAATVDLTQLVYLGRPYSQYAKVIIKYSYLDSIIQPQGWKA
jgi:hypothetical protein